MRRSCAEGVHLKLVYRYLTYIVIKYILMTSDLLQVSLVRGNLYSTCQYLWITLQLLQLTLFSLSLLFVIEIDNSCPSWGIAHNEILWCCGSHCFITCFDRTKDNVMQYVLNMQIFINWGLHRWGRATSGTSKKWNFPFILG